MERSYEITSGNFDANGNIVFYVENNNGTMFLAYPLDYETDTNFKLVNNAFDYCGIQLLR